MFISTCMRIYSLSRKQIGFKLLPFSGFMQRLNNMSRIRILSEQWSGFKGNLSQSEWPCLPSKWSKGLDWRRNRSWHKLSIKTTKLKKNYLKKSFRIYLHIVIHKANEVLLQLVQNCERGSAMKFRWNFFDARIYISWIFLVFCLTTRGKSFTLKRSKDQFLINCNFFNIMNSNKHSF